jgi:hypothetical protein
MRLRSRPTLERFVIAPVLTHADVRRYEREGDVFVEQQTCGLVFPALVDLRAKAEGGFQAAPRVHA